MSAAENGQGAAGKGGGGDKNEKDDTIVKVTAVAIGAGIAFSLYKSLFAGKKTEEPLGHGGLEPSGVPKADGLLSEVEAGTKDKAGKFEAGAKGFKGDVDAKGKEFKSDVARKGQEVKEGAEEGKEFAAEKGSEAEQTGFNWFNWFGNKVEKGTEDTAGEIEADAKGLKGDVDAKGKEFQSDVAGKGQEGKEWVSGAESKVKEGTEEGKEWAAEKGSEAKETGFNWFNWFGNKADQGKEDAEKTKDAVVNSTIAAEEKVGSELEKDQKKVTKALIDAEANVEKKATAAVHKFSQGGKPKHKAASKEIDIKRGDTLWGIARKYGVSIDELKLANGIWNADFIVAGDTLTIPK